MDPVWRRDGRETFYRNGPRMMAVTVSTRPSFEVDKPRTLREGDYMLGPRSSCGIKGTATTSENVSPDGERFLMISEADRQMYATKLDFVIGWVEELPRKMADAFGKKG